MVLQKFDVAEMSDMLQEARPVDNRLHKVAMGTKSRISKASKKLNSAQSKVNWKELLKDRQATKDELAKMSPIQRYWYTKSPAKRAAEMKHRQQVRKVKTNKKAA